MSAYYDRDGIPISQLEWCDKFGDYDYKRVACDVFGDTKVSTVWLGLDHGFAGGPPLIFETMVFSSPSGDEQWRYSTEAEALAGHHRVCSIVRAGEVLA
jgi:hypothetical protein